MLSDRTPASQLAAMLASLPCGLLLIDDNGVILDLNTTLLDWLGHSRDQLMGEHIDLILPLGGRIFYQTHLFPLLRSDGFVSEIYFALRTAEGKELPVLLNARRDTSGEQPTAVIALVVINNRQQFEGALLEAWHAEQAIREEVARKSQALDELNSELEERNAALSASQETLKNSNESKDEFIGLVAHELKNPLAALTGTFQLLARSLRDLPLNESEALLADLHLEFARLISVTDNLLMIARSEMAGLVDIEPMILPRVVQSAVSRHASLPFSRPVEVAVQPDVHLALGSDSLTEQILDNLLSNAQKYGAEGSVIEVGIGTRDGQVMASVSNEGDELTESDIERFFQPFYRSARHRNRPGVGLGLTVCQRLAEAQHGRILAWPRESGGLVISLLLPAVEELSE